MTADPPGDGPEMPGAEPLRHGLVIEWPPPGKNPAFITPHLVSVFGMDAGGTERRLSGVTRLTLHLSMDDVVTAEVETLLGEDGEPLGLEGMPAEADGGLAAGTFRYAVAAMRVRDAAG